MTNQPKRYLITAALPYANGPKHVGHLAGAYLPADIYVRYLRAQRRDVAFICGSDEHGTAVDISAPGGNYRPAARDLILETWAEHAPQAVKAADGSALPHLDSAPELANSPRGWSFNDGVLTVRGADNFGPMRFTIQR